MAAQLSNMRLSPATRTKVVTVARAMNFKVDNTHATRTAIRSLATRTMPSLRVKQDTVSPLYRFGGVHGSGSGQKTWRNKPLFRREVCCGVEYLYQMRCRLAMVKGGAHRRSRRPVSFWVQQVDRTAVSYGAPVSVSSTALLSLYIKARANEGRTASWRGEARHGRI